MSRKNIHKATLWRTLGLDRYGTPQYSQPEVIEVRWQYTDKVYTDSNGVSRIGKSLVYVDFNHEIKTGDFMYFGESNSLKPLSTAFSVKQISVTQSLSGKKVICKYIL